MIGDHHDVGLIENAAVTIRVEDFRHERIGCVLEVGDFHRQRVGREMRVQIDSREIHDLDIRDAVRLHRIEQLRHRVHIHLLVHVALAGRMLFLARDEFREQLDHRRRIENRKVVRTAINHVHRDRRPDARLLKERRHLELMSDQVVGDHRAVVVHLCDRDRHRREKFHVLAHEPLVARHPVLRRRRAREDRRPRGDGGRRQDTDGVGRRVRMLVKPAALVFAEHPGHRGRFARVDRRHQLIVAGAVKGKDQNIRTRRRRPRHAFDLLLAAIEKKLDRAARSEREDCGTRRKERAANEVRARFRAQHQGRPKTLTQPDFWKQ